MVMSDRLAVMNRGKIEQLGTPEEVYENPSTAFVAGFLGASNLISAKVVNRGAAPGLADLTLADGTAVRVPAARVPSGTSADLRVGVRPEKLRLEPVTAPLPDGHNAFTGQVILGTFLGLSHQYTVRGPAETELVVYVQNIGATPPPALGETVRLAWLPEHTFVV